MDKNIELPVGWKVVRLNDVCKKILGGGTPSTHINEYWNGTIPWISSADIHGLRSIAPRKFITKQAVENSTTNVLPKGGILVVTRVSLGKIAIAPYDVAFSQDNQGLILDEKQITQSYALICLSKAVQIFKHQSRGTTISGVTKKQLVDLKIPLPPLKEQIKIVEKIEELFSELDKGVENLKIAQQQLSIYRQAVLKNGFVGEYENAKIGNLFDFTGGGTPSKKEFDYWNGNINWASVKDVKGDYLDKTKDKITDQGLVNSASNIANPGEVILITRISPGKVIITNIRTAINQDLKIIKPKFKVNDKYVYYLFKSIERECIKLSSGTTVLGINLTNLRDITIPQIDIDKQYSIVNEIESRLSVCDKTEETIITSLQQAEALRQSILKKAFEGKLVKQKAVEIYKPKNEYFYQVQVLAAIATASKQRGINHGEMTIAKYAYLVDKIYQIPIYYNYKRWHLGPYPPEIKKAITNGKFFSKVNNSIEVKDIDALTKYNNPYTNRLNSAIDDLSDIFEGYNGKDRSHQIELLATVCKVIEDIQSMDLKAIRQSMAEWVIDLPTTQFKNKAQKFSEEDTRLCIELIKNKGWNNKLIKDE